MGEGKNENNISKTKQVASDSDCIKGKTLNNKIYKGQVNPLTRVVETSPWK